jgi:hypothetical protein
MCVSSDSNHESDLKISRTMFLVMFKLIKMSVACGCSVDVCPTCDCSEWRARESRQWVPCEAIEAYAYDNLATSQFLEESLLPYYNSPSSGLQCM